CYKKMGKLSVVTTYSQRDHEMCSTETNKDAESFNNVSEKAAQLELAEEWGVAAEYWLIASQRAKSHDNQEWSYSRYLFCQRMRKNDGVWKKTRFS
ncbi:TPA: ANR family transcriptional regulator, partial [Serratia marcescens]|nr:ANR family transcriptional regulator [Serratia marcescens]